MTTTTINFFVSPSALEPSINTARLEHWFKRVAQLKSAEMTLPADVSTARVDHWFPVQAKADQRIEQGHGTIGTARAHTGLESQAERQLYAQTGLLAWWKTLRERRAMAQAEAELRALAFGDPRVLRDLQVARDMAEWKPQR